ncbi:unnamed protein product, partial [Vitis vinifera]
MFRSRVFRTYDFIYLPIDFKNKCNVGYAFVNMIDPLHIVPLHRANGKKWEKFNSEKRWHLLHMLEFKEKLLLLLISKTRA